jgi:hypothetical protein
MRARRERRIVEMRSVTEADLEQREHAIRFRLP